jgi:nitrite reductase (NADH) large subunit
VKLVVIGNGMVGQRLLESLPPGHRFEVTVLAEEARPAYDRVQLSSFFSGKSADDLSIVPQGFFEQHDIKLHLSERVDAIDRESQLVRTASGRELAYDNLVLATGSYPFVPPLPGKDRPGCFVYRTIEDLEAIRESSRDARTGVVIGGGLLGLEAAKALRDLGLETHVVEFAPRLMALQVDDGGGGMLRRKIEALGVRVHTGKNTREIVDGASARHCLKFADGTSLEADVVVFSAGIRPRDDLARRAALSLGERGGIVIDDACRTSDPAIYAIGECALWRNRIFGLVAPGYQMAQVTAARLCGDATATFGGADMSTKLKLLGVDVASIGDAHAASPGARTYSFVDERREVYKKLVVNEDGSRLLGAVLVGDTEDYGSWLQMMLNSLPLPEYPEELVVPPRSGGA